MTFEHRNADKPEPPIATSKKSPASGSTHSPGRRTFSAKQPQKFDNAPRTSSRAHAMPRKNFVPILRIEIAGTRKDNLGHARTNNRTEGNAIVARLGTSAAI